MENKIVVYKLDICNKHVKCLIENTYNEKIDNIRKDPNKYILIAHNTYSGIPVGYIILDIKSKSIEYIYVIEIFRRKGVAKELMLYALSVASKHNINLLSYNYNINNEVAGKILYDYNFTRGCNDETYFCNILVGESVGRE